MKYICLIFSAVLLFSILCGSANEQQNGNSVTFYYCATEAEFGSEMGLFAAEERYVSYNPGEYEALIQEYLNGAISADCVSPFPGGTTLVDYSLSDNAAAIVLSPHMGLQSQADVITCCACLCKTLFTLSDLEAIFISVDGDQINGENELVFHRDSFIIYDDILNTPNS